MSRKNVLLLFGGQSSEHDVSCVSAATIAEAVDPEAYRLILVGITKEGHWKLTDNVEAIRDGSWEKGRTKAVLFPDTDHTLLLSDDGTTHRKEKVDIAFPVLHGLFGEDGTVQGLFELAHLPYVGCGHLSSAVTMDKFFTKVIAGHYGIAQAAFEPVYREELTDMDAVVERVEAFRPYPVFIKPSNAGSSRGMTKAHNRDELVKGLQIAAENDRKILVEETINGRELECAVFGYGKKAFAAGVGEVISAAEFYDYDAKYNNAASETVMNPELPEGKREEICQQALTVYRGCDCFGFARVDFFLEKETNRVVFNEINTIPGHTPISMYPMLMKEAGYEMKDYVNELLRMSYARHDFYGRYE